MQTIKQRRIHRQQLPYLQYKIMETAVHLFKRFYLVNLYESSFAQQNFAVALYLALKIQQVGYDGIEKIANRLKIKDTRDFAGVSQFGYEGYSQAQILFLKGIQFQLNTSSIFVALQSLQHRINKSTLLNKDQKLKILQQQLRLGQQVLLTQLIFIYNSSKLALSLMVLLLQRQNIQLQCLQLKELLIQNWDQIVQMKIRIDGIGCFKKQRLKKGKQYMLAYQIAYNQTNPNFQLKRPPKHQLRIQSEKILKK